MNIAIAVVTSIVLGLVGTRYSHYSFWKSWGAGAFWVGFVALVIVYGLFGLIGYGIFAAVGGEGPGGAALHGGFGYALLRVQIGRVGPADEDRETAARNVLSLIREWLFEFLGKRAHVEIVRWTNGRTDEKLSSTALDLFHRRFDDTTKIGKKRLNEIQEATRNLQSDDDKVAADARGRLRGNVLQQIEGARLTKDEL